MKVLDEFFQNGVMNAITNSTFICLIPKKEKSLKIRDFRPIILVSSLYKIVAKILSLRLRETLLEIIFECQGTYVRGRLILDVALVANEVVEDYRARRNEGFDFEKAYNHVD